MKTTLSTFNILAIVLLTGTMLPIVVQAMDGKRFGLPAPENATPERIRNDIRAWLTFGDLFDAAQLVNPAQYGARAYPAIREVLNDVDGFRESLDAPSRGRFAIGRSLELLAAIGVPDTELAATVRPYLGSDSEGTRAKAVRALAVVGTPRDLPVLVTMLYHPDSTVRHHAVIALGKLGDESAFLVLDIWEKQASATDEARPATEKWIDNAMPNRLEEARQAIQARLDASEE